MASVENVVEDVIVDIIDKVELIEGREKRSSNNGQDVSNHRPELINKQSSGLERCRICFDTGQVMPIIHPCYCKGTMGSVHLLCLERWLAESNGNACELCGYRFSLIRVPRYNVLKSLWVWLRSNDEEYRPHRRSLRIDIIRCLIVTPLTIVCSYMCMIIADSYMAYNNSYILMTALIGSYLIWLYLTAKYHHRIWFHWWKKKTIVRVQLPEEKIAKTRNTIEY